MFIKKTIMCGIQPLEMRLEWNLIKMSICWNIVIEQGNKRTEQNLRVLNLARAFLLAAALFTPAITAARGRSPCIPRLGLAPWFSSKEKF